MKKLITLSLILMSFKTPSKHNEILYVKHNKIVNNSNFDNLEMLLHMCLNELDLIDINIKILPFKKEWVNNLNYKAFILSIDINNYVIYIDNETEYHEIIKIITHEAIHIKQYHLKQLTVRDSSIEWNGKIYLKNNLIDYKYRPWEINAFKDGKHLSELLNDKLN